MPGIELVVGGPACLAQAYFTSHWPLLHGLSLRFHSTEGKAELHLSQFSEMQQRQRAILHSGIFANGHSLLYCLGACCNIACPVEEGNLIWTPPSCCFCPRKILFTSDNSSEYYLGLSTAEKIHLWYCKGIWYELRPALRLLAPLARLLEQCAVVAGHAMCSVQW